MMLSPKLIPNLISEVTFNKIIPSTTQLSNPQLAPPTHTRALEQLAAAMLIVLLKIIATFDLDYFGHTYTKLYFTLPGLANPTDKFTVYHGERATWCKDYLMLNICI